MQWVTLDQVEEFNSSSQYGTRPIPQATWHGPAPRLPSVDGSTSYGRWVRTTTSMRPWLGVVPEAAPPGAVAARLRIQVKPLSDEPTTDEPEFPMDSEGRPQLVALVRGSRTGFSTYGVVFYHAAFDVWTTLDVDIPPITNPNFALDAEEGKLEAMTHGLDWGYELSALIVSVGYGGRPTPLQWRQRTDELGVSGVRPARHASTYYATNRARGMV